MDTTSWLIFIGTVIGVSLVPGPSTFIAFAHGASYGYMRSLITACGNASASTLQAIAASAGLGLLITNSAFLFATIKYAGAFYLIYVGIRLWRSAAEQTSFGTTESGTKEPTFKLFSGGFTVAISNPKAIAFFTALFPQFLSPDGNGISQLLGMIIVVCSSAFAVAAFYGFLGAYICRLQLSRSLMKGIYKTTGGFFVASGVGLATSRNS